MLLLETAHNRLTLADGVLGSDRMEYLEVSGDAGIAAVRRPRTTSAPTS